MNTGLEKILQKIEKDSLEECTRIIDKAKEEAQELYLEAEKAAIKSKEERLRKVKEDNERKLQIAKKTFELEKRNRVLKAKNDLMNEVIELAISRVRKLQDKEYLPLTKELIRKYSIKGKGVLRFSPNDTVRIQDAFIDEVNSSIKGEDRSLVLGEPLNIEDGFIIEYEDININCTYESLLRNAEDEIREEVYKMLFGR